MNNNNYQLKIIARIRSDFPTKFGIPRQSGLVPSLEAKIVFEPDYRNADALRGLEDFSYLWLIWGFSEAERDDWSPTVRPPRLGGNARKGVFATRSPFRPNAIGLSSVKLESIEKDGDNGTVLCVSGADLMDGTPIYDIKPYLPYTDCHPDATSGFVDEQNRHKLKVEIPDDELMKIPENKRETLRQILMQDPRPAYHNNPDRTYGFFFADREVKFSVDGDTIIVGEIV